MIVDSGIHDLLNVCFRQGPKSRWYVGLIGSGTVAESDTPLSKGWVENVSYTQATRQRMLLGEQVVFTMTDFSQVAGIFVASNSGKQSTDGTLFGAVLFDSPIVPGKSRTLTLSYDL